LQQNALDTQARNQPHFQPLFVGKRILLGGGAKHFGAAAYVTVHIVKMVLVWFLGRPGTRNSFGWGQLPQTLRPLRAM